MAAPLLLAALGYGIYNKYQKEKVLEDAMKDPTKTFGQKLSAVLETNPEMRDWPMVQRMMETNNAVEAQLMQEETSRKKALWDETFKQVPAQSQEAFLRANPEEAAAFAPERYKVLTAKDKNAADLKLWTDKAGITDQFTDENRIQQQVVTQQNAAYSAGLQRETAAINRQAELDAKIAAGEPITVAEKQQQELDLAATKKRQELAIIGEAKAAEQAKAEAELQQSYADDLLEYKTLMEAGAGAFDPRANTLAKNLQVKKAKMLAGPGFATNQSDEANAKSIIPEPGLFKTTSALTAKLDSELNDLAVKGFKPRIKAPKFDPTAAFEEE